VVCVHTLKYSLVVILSGGFNFSYVGLLGQIPKRRICLPWPDFLHDIRAYSLKHSSNLCMNSSASPKDRELSKDFRGETPKIRA
jgi:hypothetical protein